MFNSKQLMKSTFGSRCQLSGRVHPGHLTRTEQPLAGGGGEHPAVTVLVCVILCNPLFPAASTWRSCCFDKIAHQPCSSTGERSPLLRLDSSSSAKQPVIAESPGAVGETYSTQARRSWSQVLARGNASSKQAAVPEAALCCSSSAHS